MAFPKLGTQQQDLGALSTTAFWGSTDALVVAVDNMH